MIINGIMAGRNPEGSTRFNLKDYIHKRYKIDYINLDSNFKDAVKIGVKQKVFMHMNGYTDASATNDEIFHQTQCRVDKCIPGCTGASTTNDEISRQDQCCVDECIPGCTGTSATNRETFH
ncbi:hypothetical protein BGX31_004659 [Mortierella sp. GBA43]|nr:hypothetical protein BGX31_004659 [Mortierella sp. GBA43]